MAQLAAPVQLIDRTTVEPITNPVAHLVTGDVTISTGGAPHVNITTLPTASTENTTDLIIQLTEEEIAEDYTILFRDPDRVWANIDIIVDLNFIDPNDPSLVVAVMVGFEGTPEEKNAEFSLVLRMANSLFTSVASKCSGLAALDEEAKGLIVNNLAAHFYAQQGRRPGVGQSVKSDQVGDGVGRTWTAPASIKGHGLQSTTFGQIALTLDVSGCLAAHEASAIKPRRKAQVKWLGKRGRHYR